MLGAAYIPGRSSAGVIESILESYAALGGESTRPLRSMTTSTTVESHMFRYGHEHDGYR